MNDPLKLHYGGRKLHTVSKACREDRRDHGDDGYDNTNGLLMTVRYNSLAYCLQLHHLLLQFPVRYSIIIISIYIGK